MNHKKQLANELIKSFTLESDNWGFGEHTADNNTWGIRVWIANVPILNICVHKPTEVKFSLIDRFRIHSAMSRCRSLKIIRLKNK